MESKTYFIKYKYKGYTYEVEYPINIFYSDYAASPRIQHKDAKKIIDERIAESKKPKQYEDSAEYGLKKFFEFYEENK